MADVTFNEAAIAGAFNLQGDPGGFAIALPTTPNTVSRDGRTVAFWFGPRSWLVFGERVSSTGGGAVFDVSASRVAWTLEGPGGTDVLSKHCPLDFHASRFAPGTCAQSLFGQVNALYYRHASREAFTLFVARSFSRDVALHLRNAIGREPAAARAFLAD